MYTDPEAFSTELEEQSEILQEIAVINAARQALDEEMAKEKNKRRYARVAREYVPELRKIFWNGTLREDARELIEAISLEQTQPLSAIENAYDFDANAEYVEVDSYTREIVTDPIPVTQTQWDRDYAEVQREVMFQEEHPVMELLDEDMYDLARKMMADPVVETVSPTVITDKPESEILRYIQELRNLGYTEEQIQFAVTAQVALDLDVVDERFDDRGISSVPIRQGQEQEMNLTTGYQTDIKIEWRRFKGGIRLAERTARMKLNRLGVDQTNLAVAKEMIWCKPNWLDLEWMKYRTQRLQKAIKSGVEVLLPLWVGHVAQEYPIQDVYLFALGLELDLEEISVPGWNSLAEFDEEFGDEIIEDALGVDPVDPKSLPIIGDEIDRIVDKWEQEIIATFQDDGPVRLTKAYARGVFGALSHFEGNLDDAGWQRWRWEKSRDGARAYDLVYHQNIAKGMPDDKARKDAMRAFWNCARVVAINSKGLKVKSILGDKEQFCAWPLARWKIQRGEIAFENGDKQRLKSVLEQKGWGEPITAAL